MDACVNTVRKQTFIYSLQICNIKAFEGSSTISTSVGINLENLAFQRRRPSVQVTKCFVNKKTKQKKSNSNVIKHPIKSDVCIKTAPTSRTEKKQRANVQKSVVFNQVCLHVQLKNRGRERERELLSIQQNTHMPAASLFKSHEVGA